MIDLGSFLLCFLWKHTLSLLYWLERVVGLTSSMTVRGDWLVYPMMKYKKNFIIVTNHLGFLEMTLKAKIKWENVSSKIMIIQWNTHTHKHMEFEPGILFPSSSLPTPERERVLDYSCIALFRSKLKLHNFRISHHIANFLLLRLFGATFTQFSLGHDRELVRPWQSV